MMIADMNSFERLDAALSGRPVDRPPFSPFLAYLWESLPETVQSRGQLAFLKEIGADPLWRGAPCPVVATMTGVETTETRKDGLASKELRTPVGAIRYGWRSSETGNTNFLVKHPLQREEDWKVLAWIEERVQFSVDLAAIMEHILGDGREGLSIGMLLPRGKTAFQTLVESDAGTEALAYALQDFPETVEACWRVMMENDLKAARLAAEAEAPYSWFLTWEDSSTQNYSPALYERFIEPEISALAGILRETGGKRYAQHACGHVARLLDPMKRSGISAIESVSPPPTGDVEISEVRVALGPSIAIIGGLEPLTLLTTPLAEIPAYVDRVLRELSGGPFVLANSDSCPPGVSVGKLAAVARRVAESPAP